MKVSLHKLARTTPAIRQEIQNSNLSYRKLAEKYNISIDTVSKWKNRKDTQDRSHARLNNLSSVSALEEEIITDVSTVFRTKI